METHRLVLPGDLNQYGYLFGGRLLAWIDEASWIRASLDHPDCVFVTVALETVEFHHSVRQGTILRITCEPLRMGKTSVTYSVVVVDEKAGPHPIFTTRVSFVNVDGQGRKRPIPRAGSAGT